MTTIPATVEVATEFVMVDGQERPVRFIVTTSTGYRAVLPACLRDECFDGSLQPCTKPNGHIQAVNAWLQHCRTHCHGWHAASADRFAADVAKTFKPQKPKWRTLPGVSFSTRHWRNKWVECPSWPVVEEKPLPAPCDCESCRVTLTLIGAAA